MKALTVCQPTPKKLTARRLVLEAPLAPLITPLLKGAAA